MWRRLAWAGLCAMWIFVAIALLSYDAADAPGHFVAPHNNPALNLGGPVGAFLAHHLFMLLGGGVWALMLGLAVGIGCALGRRPLDQPKLRTVGLVLVASAVGGILALAWPFGSVRPEGAGGIVGVFMAHELGSRFGELGAWLWIGLLFAVGAVLAFDELVDFAGALIARKTTPALARAASRTRARLRATDIDDDEELERVARKKTAVERAAEVKEGVPARKRKSEPDEAEYEYEDDEYEEDEYEYEDEDEDEEEAELIAEDDDEDDVPGAPQVFDADSLREKIAKLPVRFSSAQSRIATDDDMRDLQTSDLDMEGYRFPPLDLLEDPEDNYSEKMDAFVREQASALEEALRVYKIEAEVVGIDSGPVITLYELKLAPGTKVSQIMALSSDIARALKAVNIRIVPNTQGRDTVGVEAPNRVKERVRLKELMSHGEGSTFGKMKLPMFLGKDAHGDPLIEDLAKMPHMLVAGTTGSGKSVCLNTIIMSFLYAKKPNELKLVLIDPKMVELAQFRDIPHLMCPVITEMAKACAILEWAVGKMEERYELLAEAGVRDISSYNDLSWEELKERFEPASEQEEARIPRKLPYVVFVIDELADMMMTQKEVEHSIVRIAQKARAVGIHLVLATQRPQANVVTGLIKSNMPGRISFKVASGMDSRIVLDQKGGELLLGQGDMLFLSPHSHKLIRSQGTLVEDRETRRVVRFLKEVASPSFERQLMQIRSGAPAEVDDHVARSREAAEEDPLFDKSVEIVLETKRGSVSLLQRRLAIGYTRASRLIDLMGMAGIIGDHKGTVAREVMITPEVWEAMKEQAAKDAAEPQEAPAGGAPERAEAQGAAKEDQEEALFGSSVKAEADEIADADSDGELLSGADDEAIVEAPPFEPSGTGHELPILAAEEVVDIEDDEGEALTMGAEMEAKRISSGDGGAVAESEMMQVVEDGVEADADDEENEGYEYVEVDDEVDVEDEEETDGEYEYVYVDEDGNEVAGEHAEDDDEEWEYEEVVDEDAGEESASVAEDDGEAESQTVSTPERREQAASESG